MINLKERIKKLEAIHKGRKVYIFRPEKKGLKDLSKEQLLTIPGTWSSAKGSLSKAPRLNQEDYVIIDNI